MTTYHVSLTASVANEHVNDLLRAGAESRAAARVPARDSHHSRRRRLLRWGRATARSATPRSAWPRPATGSREG